MNKLTITDKVFVPVETRGNLSDFFMIRYKKDLIGIKEETDKYVLSREQMEQVIRNAFNAARVKCKTNDYGTQGFENSQEYINSIL